MYILPVHLVRMKAARLRRKILRDAVPYRRFSNRAEGRMTRTTMGQAPGVPHEDPCERLLLWCCVAHPMPLCGVASQTGGARESWRRKEGRLVNQTPARSHLLSREAVESRPSAYIVKLHITQLMHCRAYLRRRRWTAKLMNCRTYEVHNLFRLQTSINPLQQGSGDKSSRNGSQPQRHRQRSDSMRRFHAAALSAHRIESRQADASNRFLRSRLDERPVFGDIQRLARCLRYRSYCVLLQRRKSWKSATSWNW